MKHFPHHKQDAGTLHQQQAAGEAQQKHTVEITIKRSEIMNNMDVSKAEDAANLSFTNSARHPLQQPLHRPTTSVMMTADTQQANKLRTSNGNKFLTKSETAQPAR